MYAKVTVCFPCGLTFNNTNKVTTKIAPTVSSLTELSRALTSTEIQHTKVHLRWKFHPALPYTERRSI